MIDEVHLSTVRPWINPGGLWIRLCTDSALLAEHALADIQEVSLHSSEDAKLALQALARGEDTRLYIYDGDTGECRGTLIHFGEV